MHVKRIVITSGEPAGIGPDTCVALATSACEQEIVIAGDAGLLAETAAALGTELIIEPYDPARPATPQRAGILKCLHVGLARPVSPGRLDVQNAPYVIAMLDRACDGCMNGEFAAMVTAPVQKSILLEAGFPFSGHTEYLAARCGAPLPVMMLIAGRLRVALATTHLALADVPKAITRQRLRSVLGVVAEGFKRFYRQESPRITVLGLNPHAGEAGHLGREEIDTIAPVIAQMRAQGLRIEGPIPADTAFTPPFLAASDVILAMYHDQGLPVLKHVGFGNAVNMTLGLPILRTSVDHGTALALARSGRADSGSMRAALALAVELGGRCGADAGP